MDYLIENNLNKQLATLLTTYTMLHTVNFTTRIQNNSSTAIDNIAVDDRNKFVFFISHNKWPTKHNAQIFKIKIIYATVNKFPLNRSTRLLDIETVMNCQTVLKEETWESVYIDKDPNYMFNLCLCAFLKIFQASF